MALWRLVGSLRLSPRLSASLWVGSLLIWAAYNIAKRNGPLISEVIYLGENLHFNDAYIIAVLFAANLYGFQGLSAYFTRILHRWSPIIRWGAGATFSIYLMHYPLALFLGAIAAWPPGSWQTRLIVSGGTVLGVFGFAAVTERRKDRWRRGVTFLANRLIPAMATRP